LRWADLQPAAAEAGAESVLAAAGDAPYLSPVTDPIFLTASAAARVAAIAGKQGKPALLRLAVDGGGCAGFSYRFALADVVEADDAVATTDGVRLLVDPVSLDLVAGSAVDFVEDLGGAAFKVTNPNAASGCGCGSSFSV
jgi:iron-sulfur cluster assembly accessory protein